MHVWKETSNIHCLLLGQLIIRSRARKEMWKPAERRAVCSSPRQVMENYWNVV